ncbi:MAG: c-type cytochrome [Alphaproteobacteria bacterium]
MLFLNIIFVLAFAFTNPVLSGDVEAGKTRYAQNCGNCHGPAGMGLASYPKISGKEIPYLIDRLKTYRAGTKIGPNSSLMIMMAKPLSDTEITNLAAYLNAQNTK